MLVIWKTERDLTLRFLFPCIRAWLTPTVPTMSSWIPDDARLSEHDCQERSARDRALSALGASVHRLLGHRRYRFHGWHARHHPPGTRRPSRRTDPTAVG